MKNNNINEIIITNENEKEYWSEFKKTSSPRIKEALIKRYTPLVKYEAFKIKAAINFENYAKNTIGFEDEDFESLGFLELLDAIDRYNPNNESDIKFETYASMRIQGAIFDAFRRIDGWPKSVRREIKKLNKTIEITIGIKMQNNLTKKEINNLYNWAKKYDIKKLQTKYKNKLLDIKELMLGELSRAEKNFSYIPNEIFKLVNLKELYIKSINLKALPKDIGNLINLEELTIGSNCKLKKLPKEIGKLTNLKKLEIRCEKLNELPKELFNLTNLKEFEIRSENL